MMVGRVLNKIYEKDHYNLLYQAEFGLTDNRIENIKMRIIRELQTNKEDE